MADRYAHVTIITILNGAMPGAARMSTLVANEGGITDENDDFAFGFQRHAGKIQDGINRASVQCHDLGVRIVGWP